MTRAIELAREVEGRTSPNPPVGAVLVKDGTVVGEGSTQPSGRPHAEIVALRAAGEWARHSTLYVTLEPCSHWGRTPPCADALIREGVAVVHAAVLDPNPRVQGEGVRRLREHGIEVVVGECSGQASQLIEAHARYTATGIPFVTLFQSGPADALVKQVRVADTVITDDGPMDPVLARAIGFKAGVSQGRRAKVGSTGLIMFDVRSGRGTSLGERGVQPDQFLDWRALLMDLGLREVTSALISSGGTVAASMLENHLVDRIIVSTRVEVPPGFAAVPDEDDGDAYVAGYPEPTES